MEKYGEMQFAGESFVSENDAGDAHGLKDGACDDEDAVM